ncbi:DUF2256 domain-containing protein [Roseomonas populi]|uniref:DUF2256 domain-containing protein n=1 Tax=Roseomonas populi TaxID=3121582 RepID=A0ABT1X1F7_9PROT|nr:DUF2256 domain-containing protein [Roseomonas pecuniae]MCR0980809.1 DUF2256 domain-containing protein [Roseomonas pecuniae]
MVHRKPHLPEKTCATCGRPFSWRRKWARDWDAVRHCSDACRSGRHPAAKKNAEIVPTPLAPPGHRG